MTPEMDPEQQEAAKRLHQIGNFLLPEAARMCDDAAFDDIRFTCVMIFACAKDRSLFINTVLHDERVSTEAAVRIVEIALMNMTGEGAPEHFIRKSGSGPVPDGHA